MVLPRGKDKATEVEVTFAQGKKRGGGVAWRFITLTAPEGWLVDPDHGKAKVRVTPDQPQTVTECPYAQEDVEDELQERDAQADPNKDVVCNLKKMILTVSHGDGGTKRGPFGDGRFELVRERKWAERPEQALVCSRYDAPVVQVTGSRRKRAHDLALWEESKEYTRISVGYEADGGFCAVRHTAVVGEDDNGDPIRKTLIHPYLLLVDRGQPLKEVAARRKGDKSSETYSSLLVPVNEASLPGSAARRLGAQRFDWAPVVPTLPINVHTPELAMDLEGELWATDELGVHQILIEAQSCGEPDVTPADVAVKTDNLRAIVEVFPADERRFYIGNEKPEAIVGALEEGTFITPAAGTEFDPQQGFDLATHLKPAAQRGFPQVVALLNDAAAAYDLSTGDLADTPVAQGALAIEVHLDGEEKTSLILDDGAGHLTGDALASGGTVDYATGKMTGTTKPLAKGSMVVARQGVAIDDAFVVDPARLGPQWDEKPADLEVEGEGEVQEGALPGLEPDRPKEFRVKYLYETGREPAKFELQPPSLCSYPYLGSEAQEYSYKPDETKSDYEEKNNWGTQDDPDAGKPPDPEKWVEGGLLPVLADMRISWGINGRTWLPPDDADALGKSLRVVIDVVCQLVNAIASKDRNHAGGGYGFGFALEFSLLKGHYARYWGWKEDLDHRVFHWSSAEIEMEVLMLKFEVLGGISYAFSTIKFEAVLFGSIQGALQVTWKGETQPPSKRTGVKNHDLFAVDVPTEAKLGAKVVVGSQRFIQIEAGIKTGFDFRFVTQTHLGTDLEVYFNGLVVYLEAKVLGVFARTVQKTLVKGNVPGWPCASLTFGGKEKHGVAYVQRGINRADAKIKYLRSRYLPYLHKYQELQVVLVAAKEVRAAQQYPLTTIVPSYRFDEEGDFTNADGWSKNQRLFQQQWIDCTNRFSLESHKVAKRRWGPAQRHPPLSERLQRKESRIREILDGFLLPKLKALDALERKLDGLRGELVDEMARAGGDIPEYRVQVLLDKLDRLDQDKVLHFRYMEGRTRGKNDLEDLEQQIMGLQHYARLRRHW